MKSSDGMRVRDRKREIRRNGRNNSGKRNASIVDLVEVGKNMIAKTGGGKDGRWEAGHRCRKETDLTKAETYPATGVDGVAVKGRGSRTHVKLPRRVAPAECGIREVDAAVEVSR